jgi:hypothetical protein
VFSVPFPLSRQPLPPCRHTAHRPRRGRKSHRPPPIRNPWGHPRLGSRRGGNGGWGARESAPLRAPGLGSSFQPRARSRGGTRCQLRSVGFQLSRYKAPLPLPWLLALLGLVDRITAAALAAAADGRRTNNLLLVWRFFVCVWGGNSCGLGSPELLVSIGVASAYSVVSRRRITPASFSVRGAGFQAFEGGTCLSCLRFWLSCCGLEDFVPSQSPRWFVASLSTSAQYDFVFIRWQVRWFSVIWMHTQMEMVNSTAYWDSKSCSVDV